MLLTQAFQQLEEKWVDTTPMCFSYNDFQRRMKPALRSARIRLPAAAALADLTQEGAYPGRRLPSLIGQTQPVVFMLQIYTSDYAGRHVVAV